MSSETCSGLGRGLFLLSQSWNGLTRGGALLESAAMAKPADSRAIDDPTSAPREPFSRTFPASKSPAEFTLKAIVLGAIFGVIFGAVTSIWH